eukprot:GEMP01003162.1.p1 GENE.GEMP01003162.1~~GEMP01003162.1.p1  ORF type:complete len:126 (-),score=3.26 GEMP01003162.1:3635-4012(-)
MSPPPPIKCGGPEYPKVDPHRYNTWPKENKTVYLYCKNRDVSRGCRDIRASSHRSPPPSFSLPHKKSTDSPGFSLVETEQNNSKYENKNNQQNDECSVRRDCTHPKKTTLLNTRKIGNKFKIIRP